MARTIVEIPSSFVKWGSFSISMDSRTKSGNPSTTGNGQTAFGAQPRWMLSGSIVVDSPFALRTWRALVSKVRGRVNAIRLPLNDPLRPQLADFGLAPEHIALLVGDGIPHGDETPHDDDAGYDYQPATALLAGASAGATTISADARPYGDGLSIGHFISIDDWLYQVVGVAGTTAARVYTIEPPLRSAVTTGDVVQIWARGLFIFPDDLHAQQTLQNVANYGLIEFQLEEWVNRA